MGDGVLGVLAGELARAASDEAFAQQALDAVVDEWRLDDALLVLSDGRAFRAAGREAEEFPGRGACGTGLHALPDRVPEDVKVAVSDMCAVAQRVQQLAHEASHDALTGLVNRRAFDTELAAAVEGAKRYGWRFALVLVDLDGLKPINDEHGHSVGDAVLRAVGCELTHSVRVGDVAARLGGDEFGLIVMEADAARVSDLLGRVTRSVNQSLAGVTVTLSAGTALVPDDGIDAEALYRLADERLYLSKRG